MTNAEIGNRIRETRISRGKTLEDIASEIGVVRSTVQRYETGKIDKIKLPVISAIADALGVNDAWLIGKSDKMVLTDADRFQRFADAFNAAHPELLSPVTKKSYPLIGEVACGEPIIANEEHEVLSCGKDIDANAVVIARGDSMIGARIYDGDTVFVRFQQQVENGEIAVVIVENEITHDAEVTLKRYFRYGEDLVILRPENTAYEDIVFKGEEINRLRIIGKAVAFQSDL